MNIYGIILAAGQGKRMKSKLYKVLHPVCGQPMVGHVTDTFAELGTARTVVIVGHGAEAVKGYLGDCAEYALQAEQLGTGHAVMQAEAVLGEEEGITIIACGDTPLITAETLQGMVRLMQEKQAGAVMLTARMSNPFGYGRVIRSDDGAVQRIVEQKDCSPEEAAVQEINAGTYCFDNRKLFAALKLVTNSNAQQEYYLTDVVGILRGQGEAVLAYSTQDTAEALGVNDRVALAEAEQEMRARINRKAMLGGVTIIDPQQTYIEKTVQIGPDTVLYPGTILKGDTVIGRDCVIGPNTEVTSSQLGDGVTVKQSVLLEAVVGNEASVGPFAYLRPGANIGAYAKIGDFVEIKNATLGEGTKVSHLSYVGDAKVGSNVNIGCGAITVNYDGFRKHMTEIGDDSFIGSNVNLVAPVKIGKGAFVVAGSTITSDVGENDMAVARERQVVKTGYAEELRVRLKKGKSE
ncbi:bifunctional UDP-N-acetylglucosamine diphosphorylase/glucosamine-1-phosphate N-acetyltransferase GlmU [Paenibacillus sp. y28]|uniref:bifunctional UDP-N-acetylglucosamine diphosphorylase/glucosamine-1-phosphate N-acetyltransferase GlmU n=1 Tax=Paenibacillus sp. y28 TaxID=3129110 RepID=UPI00301B5B2A